MGQFAKQLIDKLGLGDPYENFPYQDYPFDLSTSSPNFDFAPLIKTVRPKLILEVGSWKGASAVQMASVLKEQGTDAAVVCIDTWLGSIDHLLNTVELWNIRPYYQRGHSTLFFQFLANVMHAQCQDYIVPFTNTSTTAARWFRHHRIQADLIYVDASHEEEDVYQDLVHFWEILRPGGVIFGDDWDSNWPGVICAVVRFAREQKLPHQVQRRKWLLQKAT